MPTNNLIPQHGARAVELLQEVSWLVNFDPATKAEDDSLPGEWNRKVRLLLIIVVGHVLYTRF